MALFSYPVCTWLCQYVNMGVRKWLEKSAEKQKYKLRKTLNPLSRKAFRAVSFSATKDKKKDTLKACLSFWVPPPIGRLHPSVLKCSGWQSHPSAKVFACGENACAAQKRRRPGGRWDDSPATVLSIQNIDFNRPSQKEIL